MTNYRTLKDIQLKKMTKCCLVEQGFTPGSCMTLIKGRNRRACEVTLKQEGKWWHRLIKSAHLSRPEHYFSLYQSGCNHSCLKCHSWEFSQNVSGRWISAPEIGLMAKEYEKKVTVWENKETATMWHGTDLCRSCAMCVIYGKRSWLCPGVLEPKDVILSPQGVGPARNIVAFTGGDLSCCVNFYCQASEEIKKACKDMLVLIETNGYGLTPENLDRLKESGVGSFWLDLKAYGREIYEKLCGTTNDWILKTPLEIVKRGFVLEVLTLFIPGWVEDKQIEKIARLVCNVNPNIPLTLLAFFPEYKMKDVNPPSLSDMIRVYHRIKNIGLNKVKLGNCGVFAKNDEDWNLLLMEVGKEGVG